MLNNLWVHDVRSSFLSEWRKTYLDPAISIADLLPPPGATGWVVEERNPEEVYRFRQVPKAISPALRKRFTAASAVRHFRQFADGPVEIYFVELSNNTERFTAIAVDGLFMLDKLER